MTELCRTISYIEDFLVGKEYSPLIEYADFPSASAKITIIRSDFFDEVVYGSEKSLPKTPLELLPETDVPFLFGQPRLEFTADGRIVLYADLMASAYFMLSRYEEIIKTECRDQYGRFLAKDSIVFQQRYGMRPLVDEWGMYLKNLLRRTGIEVPEERCGFSKIYLTHDVDVPFKLFHLRSLIAQYAINILRPRHFVKNPFRVFLTGKNDPYFTFPKIIAYDDNLKKSMKAEVESIYFIIAAKGRNSGYCNIRLKKFQNLVRLLQNSGATLGLHVSHEAGKNPLLLKNDMKGLHSYIPGVTCKSRHHFLRWTEPEHILQMEQAGISEDFTLGYADCAGFRVGTCRPYCFINPKTKKVSNVLIHPMTVMECTLDRPNYMNLDYDAALSACKNLIDETYKHNGELNMLWHNTSFLPDFYHERLYVALLEYIAEKTRGGVQQYSVITVKPVTEDSACGGAYAFAA